MDWSEHRELGRMECRHGRPLSEILRAPWAASRTILRYAAQEADTLGLSPAAVQEIAEVVIDWSDRISIAFSEGYNDESSARASELETRRQTLLRVALSEPPPTAEALNAATRAAGWRAPTRLRVLVAHGPGRQDFRRRLPLGSLAAELDDELCAIVPATAANDLLQRRELGSETVAALGPSSSLPEAKHSADLARRAIALASDGRLDRTELIDCATLDLPLLVFADASTASSLSQRLLAPVLDKPELISTLAAWLSSDGRPKATAARLGVHPHTVTYRLNQLREALGPIVDDPDRRLELHLAAYINLTAAGPSTQTAPRRRPGVGVR